MKDYLAIEQIRFGDRLKYTLNTSEQCASVKVPTMIMQPLVENAIKHGVYESIEPVSINFTCSLTDGYLKLEIQNDFDPDQPPQRGTGVGLQNVSERIRLAYDGKGRMTHSVQDHVFQVSLYIPTE